MNKQELIEALNQADIMLRPAAIVVNRKTAEIIRNVANALTKVFEDVRKFWLSYLSRSNRQSPKKFGQYINEKKKRMRGGYKRR